MKGISKVRAVVTVHTHGPNYQCSRYEYGSIPSKDTLLVYLVPSISRGCNRVWVYDVCVAACDVLTDTCTV